MRRSRHGPTQGLKGQARNTDLNESETHGYAADRAFLKAYPLERHLRDAQAASVMRPWTLEIATEVSWNSALRAARRRNGKAD